MLLNILYLENFGLYLGAQEFDLTPRKRGKEIRPVILFGGKNGAGKTTFLESIRLVLYGKRSLGSRISQKEYEEYLLGKIHRPKKGIPEPDIARIKLTFEHSVAGEADRYEITRVWSKKDKSLSTIEEDFIISKNGEILEDLESEYWQDFIDEIVPERVSQLFFFDGEKIQQIAEDMTGNRAIEDSIKSLLGLDLVERLLDDLDIYESRENRKLASNSDLKEIKTIENKKSKLISEKNKIESEILPSVRSIVDGIKSEIEQRERELQNQGGAFAASRDEELDKEKDILIKIEALENTIRNECEGLLPFILCPSVNGELLSLIKEEETFEKGQLVNTQLDKVKLSISENLSNKFSLDSTIGSEFSQLINECFESQKFTTKLGDDFTPKLSLSRNDQNIIQSQLSNASTNTLTRIKNASDHLEALYRGLQKARKNLNRAPDEDVVKPLFNEIMELNQDLGKYEKEMEGYEDNLKSLIFQISEVERELMKLELVDQKNLELATKMAYVQRTRKALKEYHKNITHDKIMELRQNVAECFNLLARKDDFVKSVDIDEDTFQVTIYNSDEQTISKEELSSGEKQILSISMLWGLAKSSGRPLPVIIDTPLGRLDSDHRMKLIDKYFPNASHQVIMLSTDTEVDNSLYKRLNPSISHCYHLSYDKRTRKTNAEEQYFWKE